LILQLEGSKYTRGEGRGEKRPDGNGG
jgi:hypothetical protein